MNSSKKSIYLLDYRKNIHSQFGEDGILEKIFSKLPKKKQYWSVEFGAWDGAFASNTCALIEKKKWNGVFIESDKARFGDLLKKHGKNPRVICINSFVEFEGKNRLDRILKHVKKIPHEFDLLSIDVDSCDYYIWESLKIFKPSVVVIEFNPTIPPEYKYVQPKSFDIHDGHSLQMVVDLGKKKGYELISSTDINAIFVRKEYFSLFNIRDNTPVTMFAPFADKYLSHLWQGGDGTLHLIGCNRLIWHNIIINEKKIQVLPKYLRFFPGHTYPIFQVFKKLYYQFPIISKAANLIFEW